MTTPSRVALITGASRGIGAALARRLAHDGFAVALNYASSDREANALVAELSAAGKTAFAVRADVSRTEDVKALFTAVEEKLGRIDVIVNNAGVLTVTPIVDFTDELYEKHFAINTRGVFNILREAATRVNQGGRIINTSTTALAMNMPGYAVYCGSKAAVESFTKIFAKELRGKQITVNAVAPGPVATELFFNGKTEQQIQGLAKMPPLERLGEPEDIANVVSFLASRDSGWVNGQVLRANGGLA